MCFVFALTLCGAVAAEDPQKVMSTNNVTSDGNSTEIHFLIISWDTSASKYPTPAKQVMEEYPFVKFQIRSESQANKNLTGIPQLIDWADVIYFNNLDKGSLTAAILQLNVTGKLNNKTIVVDAYPTCYVPILRLTNFNNTEFVDKNGTPLTDLQIQQAYETLSGGIKAIESLQKQCPQMASLLEVRKYWVSGIASAENRKQQLLYILSTVFPSRGFKYEKPKPMISYGLYRDGKLYTNFTEYQQLYLKENRPNVGIIAWITATWEEENTALYDSLINEFERRGINPICMFAYGTPATTRYVIQGIREYLIDNETNTSRVDAIVHTTWRIGDIELLKKYNILVFQPITLGIDGSIWNISERSDPSIANVLALKEIEGQIVPIVISTEEAFINSETGLEMSRDQPIPERINKFCDIINDYINLRYKPNKEKKIAIIYYSHPGKTGIASADSLNGPESILTILNLLKENGYNITGIPKDVDELINLLITKGINIATWAPGELEKLAENVILYPVDKFMEWYQKLPEISRKEMEEGPFGYIESIAKKILTTEDKTTEFKDTANDLINNWYKKMISTIDEMASILTSEQMSKAKNLLERTKSILNDILAGQNKLSELQAIKDEFLMLNVPGLCGWGKPPGNIMVIEKNNTKYFLIPGVFFGNIFVGPQPQRGYTDPGMLYHSTVVPPPYQYLAFYAYLQEEFKANAIIHLGRHGTYEWLPRRDVALSSADYPDICIGAMPSIYIYTMDGIGEVLHAKRRGLAVIISHLTQPLALTALNDDLLALKTLTERYMTSTEDAQKQQLFEMVKESAIKLQLNTFINLNASPEEVIDEIHDYIIELEGTATPLGLHTFGKDWTLEQVTALAVTMAEKINCIGIGQNQFITPAKAIETLPLNLTTVIEKFYTGTELNKTIEELQETLGRNLTDTEVQGLEKIYEYVHNITISPKREREMLIKALNGGYIPPSQGNDPIRTPDALPTGGNLYGLDPQKIPYWDAYINGKKMATEALKAYETTPQQLGVILWAGETQRDNGGTIGFILYLLGLEPVYQQQAQHSGNILGAKPIPIEQLGRPRIDVLITISGTFRETFPQLIVLLDRTFRIALAASYNALINEINKEKDSKIKNDLVVALNETMKTIIDAQLFIPGNDPLEMNYVAQHWLEDTKGLLKSGILPSDAGKMAITRIFGPSIGEFGIKSVREGSQLAWTWDDRLELADYYIHEMQYAYREDDFGFPLGEIFIKRLKSVEGIYHSRSRNVKGVIDLDHNYEFLGGFSIAVEKLTSKTPQLFILNQIDASKPAVETLSKFINRDLQTKLFNPQWIKEMMAQGPAGASYIASQFIDNMVGWNVLRPDAITNEMWNTVVDIYLKDKYNIGVAKWLSTGNNAYSLIDITGKLLTMAHRGFWQTNKATIGFVANIWASAIANYGPACCDCSCGNIAMMQWAMGYVNPNLLAAVKARLYGATKNSAFAPAGTPGVPGAPGVPSAPGTGSQPGAPGSTPGYTGTPGTGSQPGAGGAAGTVGVAGVAAAGAGQKGGAGKVYEVSKAGGMTGGAGNFPIYAVAGIITLVALVGAGYFLAGRKRI